MFTTKRVPLRVVLPSAWPSVSFFAYSAFVCLLYAYFEWTFLAIPFVPVAATGTAVAFYVGFKNNSPYDRLWEARRMQGSITNASRSWGILVLDYIVDSGNGVRSDTDTNRQQHR